MNGVSGVKGSSGIRRKPGGGKSATGKAGFQELLRKACMERDIKISAHAEQRMAQRGIEFAKKDIENISSAMDRVNEKGGSKAAIFYRDVVFITDARERAIITAIDRDDLKERIFTGIDSAVVI